MTWNEFKQHVDKQLADAKISGDTDIWYIDISFPQIAVNGETISDMYNLTVIPDDIHGITIS